MSARQLRTTWWVDFRFNHLRYRKRSPENTQAGARAYEATLRHRLMRGEPIEQVSARNETFEQFGWRWYNEYALVNNKPSEQRNKKWGLKGSLVPFFGRTVVAEITARDIERYKTHEQARGIKHKTINNYLTMLRKCLVTAYDWLELDGAPPKIVWLKCPPAETKFLSEKECQRLLSNAHGLVHDMLLMALHTGMRQGEIRGLQWSSIDWLNGIITVRHALCDYSKRLGSPKSNRARHIPMTTEVRESLETRRKPDGYVFLDADGKPFNHKRLARRLEAVIGRAELKHFGWHVLRHTFASRLSELGAPIVVVKDLLGHASIATTMRYAHTAPPALRAAIGLLNPSYAVLQENSGQPVGNAWLAAIQHENA